MSVSPWIAAWASAGSTSRVVESCLTTSTSLDPGDRRAAGSSGRRRRRCAPRMTIGIQKSLAWISCLRSVRATVRTPSTSSSSRRAAAASGRRAADDRRAGGHRACGRACAPAKYRSSSVGLCGSTRVRRTPSAASASTRSGTRAWSSSCDRGRPVAARSYATHAVGAAATAVERRRVLGVEPHDGRRASSAAVSSAGVPRTRSSPSSSTTTWSARPSASSSRWVHITTVAPVGGHLADQLEHGVATTRGRGPTSARRTAAGRARAAPTGPAPGGSSCRSSSRPTCWSRACSMPKRAAAARDAASATGAAAEAVELGRVGEVVAARRAGRRAPAWPTRRRSGGAPPRRRRRGRGRTRATAPSSGVRAPVIMRMAVVLPAPLGPSSTVMSPVRARRGRGLARAGCRRSAR